MLLFLDYYFVGKFVCVRPIVHLFVSSNFKPLLHTSHSRLLAMVLYCIWLRVATMYLYSVVYPFRMWFRFGISCAYIIYNMKYIFCVFRSLSPDANVNFLLHHSRLWLLRSFIAFHSTVVVVVVWFAAIGISVLSVVLWCLCSNQMLNVFKCAASFSRIFCVRSFVIDQQKHAMKLQQTSSNKDSETERDNAQQ